MDKTEKRRKIIINVIYFLIVIGAFYAFVKYAMGLVLPFIIAFFVAAILQKPVNFLTSKIKRGRGVISTICVLLLLGIVGLIVWLIGLKAVDEAKSFASFISAQVQSIPALIGEFKDWLIYTAENVLPKNIGTSVAAYIDDKFTFDALTQATASADDKTVSEAISGVGSIVSMLATPLSGAWSTVKQLPSMVLAFVICIVTACFLTADYGTLTDFVKRQLTEEKREKFSRAKSLIKMSIKKICLAYLGIIAITTTELCVGLSILKLIGVYQAGYIFPISICIAIIDIVPVLGTGTVLLPWAVICLCTGKIGLGIGILVMYAIITIVRQVIEPKLVAGQFDLPAFVTIIAMYIGIKIFGPLGIFILPLTVICIKLLTDEGILTFMHTKIGDEKAAEKSQSQEEQTNA